MMRSAEPIFFFSRASRTVSHLALINLTLGKFALYVSLAKDQWSTAAAILTPAALAPHPLPPTPPKRSIALIFRLFLGIIVGIRECGRVQELKRLTAHPVSIDKVYSTRAMRGCPSLRSLRERKLGGGT